MDSSKLKTIIDELDAVYPTRTKHSVIESKASHAMASILNLSKLIRESYSEEIADDLIKRLYRSIISEDDRKFMRKIKELKR